GEPAFAGLDPAVPPHRETTCLERPHKGTHQGAVFPLIGQKYVCHRRSTLADLGPDDETVLCDAFSRKASMTTRLCGNQPSLSSVSAPRIEDQSIQQSPGHRPAVHRPPCRGRTPPAVPDT